MKFSCTKFSIVPDKDIPLSGLFVRDAHGKHLGREECNLKIAFLESNTGEKVVFFLADLLFFPEFLSKKIVDYLWLSEKISPTKIVFAGTHTHSGPGLSFLPHEKEHIDYQEIVFEKCKKELSALFKEGKSIKKLSKAKISIPKISINRRKVVRHWRNKFQKEALMLPNPKGRDSKHLYAIEIETEDDEKSLLLSYASHPVFNRNNKLSSDYIGVVSNQLIEFGKYKNVMFFQGFGGDQRPNFIEKPKGFNWLKKVLWGDRFANYSLDHFNVFCKTISEHIGDFKDWKTIVVDNHFRSDLSKIEIRSNTLKVKKDLRLQSICMGSDLTFIAVNAEMFVQYEHFLPSSYFPIACCNGSIGYIPGSEDLDSRGYEVVQAAINNGFDTHMLKRDLKTVEERFRKFK